jgi:hypothetical protein
VNFGVSSDDGGVFGDARMALAGERRGADAYALWLSDATAFDMRLRFEVEGFVSLARVV